MCAGLSFFKSRLPFELFLRFDSLYRSNTGSNTQFKFYFRVSIYKLKLGFSLSSSRKHFSFPLKLMTPFARLYRIFIQTYPLLKISFDTIIYFLKNERSFTQKSMLKTQPEVFSTVFEHLSSHGSFCASQVEMNNYALSIIMFPKSIILSFLDPVLYGSCFVFEQELSRKA